MMSPEYARTMARYNEWMNGRVYDASATLSDARRKEDTGAFFKSIHGTLNHLLLADSIWMGRFTGRPITVTSLAQELHSDFDELRAARAAMDRDIVQWAGTLTDDVLSGDLSYTSIVNPQPRTYPMGIVVAHFFNHQTHHRGQLTTLLMQRGVDPGVTDLIALPPA
jgi:uncharacterized damage-inducible protein DinB